MMLEFDFFSHVYEALRYTALNRNDFDDNAIEDHVED